MRTPIWWGVALDLLGVQVALEEVEVYLGTEFVLFMIEALQKPWLVKRG